MPHNAPAPLSSKGHQVRLVLVICLLLLCHPPDFLLHLVLLQRALGTTLDPLQNNLEPSPDFKVSWLITLVIDAKALCHPAQPSPGRSTTGRSRGPLASLEKALRVAPLKNGCWTLSPVGAQSFQCLDGQCIREVRRRWVTSRAAVGIYETRSRAVMLAIAVMCDSLRPRGL